MPISNDLFHINLFINCDSGKYLRKISFFLYFRCFLNKSKVEILDLFKRTLNLRKTFFKFKGSIFKCKITRLRFINGLDESIDIFSYFFYAWGFISNRK